LGQNGYILWIVCLVSDVPVSDVSVSDVPVPDVSFSVSYVSVPVPDVSFSFAENLEDDSASSSAPNKFKSISKMYQN